MADYKTLLQQLEGDLSKLAAASLDEDSRELVEGMREDIQDVLSSEAVPASFPNGSRFLLWNLRQTTPN